MARYTLLIMILGFIGCNASNQAILVKEGDELLDCPALIAEFKHADNLGDNAPARRRHILALQKQKGCIEPPKISISIGVFKSFD